MRKIRIVDFGIAENGFVQLFPLKDRIIENAVFKTGCKCEVFALRKIDAGKLAVDELDFGKFTVFDRRIAQVSILKNAVDEIDTGQVGEAALHKPDLFVAAFQQWLNAIIFIFNCVKIAGVAH